MSKISKPQKILFLESGQFGGGSWRSLYQTLSTIDRDKYEPVAVFYSRTEVTDKVEDLGIPVHVLTNYHYSNHVSATVRLCYDLLWSAVNHGLPFLAVAFERIMSRSIVAALVSIIREQDIGILHLNNQINRDMPALFAVERTGCLCVSHLRSAGGKGFCRSKANYANKIVSIFIANSENTLKYWVGRGLERSRIAIVNNAIEELETGICDVRSEFRIGRSASVIGCVGRLTEYKGQGFLISAFAELIKEHPEVVLVLVGSGEDRGRYEKLVSDRNLGGKVIFTGQREDARTMMHGFDVLVLPSRKEGFGRVLLEAMDARVPIVATNAGGIPEVVGDGYSGLLVDYGDVDSLRSAIDRVLSSGSLRERLVSNGLKELRERFTMVQYWKRLDEMYADLLSETSKPMRLAIFENGLPPAYVGGAEMQAWNLAKRLVAEGHSVTVFTRQKSGYPKKETVEEVDIVRIPKKKGRMALLLFMFRSAIVVSRRASEYDVMLCFRASPGGVIGGLVSLFTGLPFATSIRGGDWYFVEPKCWGKLLLKFVFRQSSAVIVQAQKIKDDVLSKYPYLSIDVVPNGIELIDEHANGDAVVFVGNLNERKGVHVLIQAMRTLKDVPLIIAGDGPDKDRLMVLSAGMNVKFAGRIAPGDVRAFMMRNARILVLPAVAGEGFPNVLLEAMSLGLPIVASEIAGISDLLEAGKNGILVPPDNADKLAAVIQDLWSNESLRRELSVAAELASAKYSWEKVVPQVVNILSSVAIRTSKQVH